MRARRLLLTIGACLALATGCSAAGDGAESVSGDEARAAAATGAAEAPAVEELALGPSEGTCGEALEPGSAADVICGWFARFEPESCERMSDAFLAERFGAEGADGVESCEATLGSLDPVADASKVAFLDGSKDGESATLEVVDDSGGRTFTYTVSFLASEQGWVIDAVARHDERPTGGTAGQQEPATVDVEAQRRVRALLRRWYAELDTTVCDSMTDEFVELGWGEAGEPGRKLCREGIAAAEPLENVRVRTPRISGDRARARVVYGPAEARQFDTILLVRVDGRWLIDAVAATGFLP